MSTATIKLESIFNECKDMSKHELFSLLNTFTVNRAYKIVDKLCKKLMLSFDDHESVIKVSESYFKMGKHHEALRLLAKFIEKEQATILEKTRIYFQEAKILRALNQPSLAYQKVSQLLLIETEHFRERAELALLEFDFEQALNDYKEYFTKLRVIPSSFDLRLLQINYLKSLAFTGEIQKAKKMALEWLDRWSEPELKGKLFFLLGEIYLLEDKYEKSLILFEKSKKILDPDKDSIQNFEFYSRMGLIHGLLGHKEAAAEFLSQSEELLNHHDSLYSLVRLDVYKLRLGILDKNELFRLLFHPSLNEHVLDFFKLEFTHEIYHFGSFDESRVRIYLNTNEYDFCDSHSYELTEELCLLAKLKISGDWGLSLAEIKASFYPQAIHAEEEIVFKIDEMVAKLRNLYGLNVFKKNHKIFLEDDCREVYVETGIKDKPRFLDFVQIFEITDLISYYNLSTEKASSLIKIWTEKEWLGTIGDSKTPKYLVN